MSTEENCNCDESLKLEKENKELKRKLENAKDTICLMCKRLSPTAKCDDCLEMEELC